MPRLPRESDPSAATRKSLVARLNDWGDRRKWQEFFETYWKLIYNFAVRAGLNDDEAQEVVQETCIAVARNVAKYDPEGGSFKGWLLQMARWRITDQYRKRGGEKPARREGETHRTATIERLPERGRGAFEKAWEEEWQRHVLGAALARLKRKVDAEQFQIFDCVTFKGWSSAKTARELGVNIAQVYLVKHRLKGMLKKEIESLEG